MFDEETLEGVLLPLRLSDVSFSSSPVKTDFCIEFGAGRCGESLLTGCLSPLVATDLM